MWVARHALPPHAIEPLRASGACVVVCACDAAEPASVRALLAWTRRALPPLRGVWHTAGVLADSLLARQDAAMLLRTFAPKAGGAEVLFAVEKSDAPVANGPNCRQTRCVSGCEPCAGASRSPALLSMCDSSATPPSLSHSSYSGLV